MAGLQVLEEQFGAQGLRVMGFYSNDFGKQGGSDEQIKGVTAKFGLTHAQFAVAPVIGDSARPVFQWLLGHDNPGPKSGAMAPNWNFHKWLVSREGEMLASFDTRSYPGKDPSAAAWKDHEMVKAITAALGS